LIADDGGMVGGMQQQEARSTRWPVARPIAQFFLVGLVAVAVVGVATAVAARRVGQREAIVDARTTTLVKAQTVVEPVVTDGLLTGQPAAMRRIDAAVRHGVLDRSLVRVKIWTRDGLIVYSDEPRLAGTSYRLGADELTAIDKGVIEAEVSDLRKPENRFDRSFHKLLEVYLPIRTPSGKRLLFEAYYRYSAVSASGTRIWKSFAPISIGALVALELIQIPIAWSLASRLRERQRERERLLRQALEASDKERRRIAGDLHDGVVQDLAGVAFSLAGASRQEHPPVATTALLDRSAGQVRDSIKSLRSLLVDIYPPSLADAGLGSALTDLLAGVESRGVSTTLDIDALREPVREDVARVLWRAAQEAVRNVLSHAHATSVRVRAATSDEAVALDVGDDGIGFDDETMRERVAEGHVGLRALRDLVASSGGEIRIDSTPGVGTEVHVEVPLS
jgi:two-component system, NarL family, sensor kinase